MGKERERRRFKGEISVCVSTFGNSHYYYYNYYYNYY